jgi:hypothetical protein
MEKISIRNAKFAKIGLIDLIDWIEERSAKPVKEMKMVEIGSYVGDSTQIFAKRFKEVISIDPFQNGYDPKDPSSYNIPMEVIYAQFKSEILDKFENVTNHKMTSEEGSKLFKDGEFDFVYIDGNHLYEYMKLDIQCWLPKIRKSGFLGTHDYCHKLAPGVAPAWDELLGKPEARFRETSAIMQVK